MKIFPNIEAFVFIDDGYIMTKAIHIDELSAAVHATKLFDQLVGQKFNPEKSSAWATSKRAKNKLNRIFHAKNTSRCWGRMLKAHPDLKPLIPSLKLKLPDRL